MNWCKVGFHKCVREPKISSVVRPKKGPYDFRTDEERTAKTRYEICARCGLKREAPIWGLHDPKYFEQLPPEPWEIESRKREENTQHIAVHTDSGGSGCGTGWLL